MKQLKIKQPDLKKNEIYAKDVEEHFYIFCRDTYDQLRVIVYIEDEGWATFDPFNSMEKCSDYFDDFEEIYELETLNSFEIYDVDAK